jgi:hypothetical protein
VSVTNIDGRNLLAYSRPTVVLVTLRRGRLGASWRRFVERFGALVTCASGEGRPPADSELPKFFVGRTDLLPQFVGVLAGFHRFGVRLHQSGPVGEHLFLIGGRCFGGEVGFFGHVPALAALGHPQRLGLLGTWLAHRFHRRTARHTDVAKLNVRTTNAPLLATPSQIFKPEARRIHTLLDTPTNPAKRKLCFRLAPTALFET